MRQSRVDGLFGLVCNHGDICRAIERGNNSNQKVDHGIIKHVSPDDAFPSVA
jgi:hypothetical protein